jgi:ribonuclease HI
MQKAFAKRYKFSDYANLNLEEGIYLFTDGSTANNGRKDPNLSCIGGWGYVIVEDGKEIHRGSGGEVDTSISRMELLGIIKGLQQVLKMRGKCTVCVVSDSQYAIRGATEYMRGWLKRKWRNNEGQPTANIDLWKALVKLSNASEVLSYGSEMDVWFSWVKGHKGHKWNEECDKMAGLEKDALVDIHHK